MVGEIKWRRLEGEGGVEDPVEIEGEEGAGPPVRTYPLPLPFLWCALLPFFLLFRDRRG